MGVPMHNLPDLGSSHLNDICLRVLTRIGADKDPRVLRWFSIRSGPESIRIEWRRSYNGIESDLRTETANSLSGAFQAVLDWEDRADELEDALA